MSKRIPPRRRDTLSYPSPASSIDSVSSCSSFASIDSSYSTPSSPTYTDQFSLEPCETDESRDGIPRGAKVLKQNVWKVPERMRRRERWELWYSANFGTNLLEPWEKILLHLVLATILYLSYIAFSRLANSSALLQLGSRIVFYATGTTTRSFA